MSIVAVSILLVLLSYLVYRHLQKVYAPALSTNIITTAVSSGIQKHKQNGTIDVSGRPSGSGSSASTSTIRLAARPYTKTNSTTTSSRTGSTSSSSSSNTTALTTPPSPSATTSANITTPSFPHPTSTPINTVTTPPPPPPPPSSTRLFPMWPFVSNLLRSSQSHLDSSSPDHRVTPSLCVGNPAESSPSAASSSSSSSSTNLVTSSSPDTTPKARAIDHPTSMQAIPEISLLPEVENTGDGADDDDDLPPMFPAMNSAQRAGVPSSLPVNNKLPPTSMPPPPIPNRNPRMQNPSSWGTVPAPGSRQNPAAAARAPPRSQLAVQGAGASGVAAGSGLTLPGRQGKSRKKVILNPGHSPLDWARLQKSGINLRGLPHTSLLKVPPSELAKHKTAPDDVWMGLNGKVYNVSHYLPFHPGGERELMRAAGKDGTKLFNASHHWVNIDNMLEECLIGIMVSEEEAIKKEGEGELDMVD
ncbi:hypothetical protein BZA77DRAFT_308210 [Pyronema omphalodes]|nr:hypothetical protein BZA77DRAFT_308210 [Pyronema omphalodes]